MTTEKSHVGTNKQLLIGAIVVGLVAVAFTQLPLRAQGRIIEFCTLGDWPLEWSVRQQFAGKQPELRSILDFVNENPDVAGLSVTPVGLRASLQQNKAEDYDLDKPNILQALISVEALFVNVDDDRVSVFLGWEVRGADSFDVSYIYATGKVDLPDCDSIAARDRAKIGSCAFRLSPNWYALYQWSPDDIDELEKALDELR